jgi:hypothetical protein
MGALAEIFCVVAESVYSVFEQRGVKPGCFTFVLAFVISVLICAGIVWAAVAIAARMA